jgi:hypothetical protein
MAAWLRWPLFGRTATLNATDQVRTSEQHFSRSTAE